MPSVRVLVRAAWCTVTVVLGVDRISGRVVKCIVWLGLGVLVVLWSVIVVVCV